MTHRHRHPLALAAYFGQLATTTLVVALSLQNPPSRLMGHSAWATTVPEAAQETSTSPEAHSGRPPAPPAQPLSPLAEPHRDVPWWPWIAAFPALGVLLWWILRDGKAPDRDGEDKSAIASAHEEMTPDGPVPAHSRRIILTPYSSAMAYAYWELPASEVADLQRRNDGLSLRLHDVTDRPPGDLSSHPEAQRWACDMGMVGDRHLPIPQAHRQYTVELGYGREGETWHSLMQSDPVQVAGPIADPTPAQGHDATASLPRPTVTRSTITSPTLPPDPDPSPLAAEPQRRQARASLVAHNCRQAVATWDIAVDPNHWQETAHLPLTVRLYDVTELPGGFALGPNSMAVFEAERTPQGSLTLPVAIDDRDYLIEVGYLGQDGQWHVWAKSSPVRVPAC